MAGGGRPPSSVSAAHNAAAENHCGGAMRRSEETQWRATRRLELIELGSTVMSGAVLGRQEEK